MPGKLDFSKVEEAKDVKLSKQESAMHRWKSREADPTVQMSVRMQATDYDRFRILCKKERRTNGDMLATMMDHYEHFLNVGEDMKKK